MQNKKKSIIFAIKQKSISNQQNRYKVFYKKLLSLQQNTKVVWKIRNYKNINNIKSNHNNETRKINLELASCFPARQGVWVKEEPESDYPFWNLLQMTRVTRIWNVQTRTTRQTEETPNCFNQLTKNLWTSKVEKSCLLA